MVNWLLELDRHWLGLPDPQGERSTAMGTVYALSTAISDGEILDQQPFHVQEVSWSLLSKEVHSVSHAVSKYNIIYQFLKLFICNFNLIHTSMLTR